MPAELTDLRERVRAAGDGGLTVPADELVERLGGPERADRLLQRSGLHAEPRVTRAEDAVVLAEDAGYAVQGALAAGLLAVLVGLGQALVYAGIFAVATAVSVALLIMRWPRVDALVPHVVPRGRRTGVVVTAAVVVVAGIVVAVPAKLIRGA